jgi:hypothetical protein
MINGRSGIGIPPSVIFYLRGKDVVYSQQSRQFRHIQPSHLRILDICSKGLHGYQHCDAGLICNEGINFLNLIPVGILASPRTVALIGFGGRSPVS